MNKINRILRATFVFAVLFVLTAIPREASAKALDYIHNYEITAEVNEDATVTLIYDITWQVLDSSSEGPLTWAKVGIPNSHYLDYDGLSSNVSYVTMSSSGGHYAEVHLDRSYYKDEVVNFSFMIRTDNLYLIGEDGFTTYTFTPGWFDDIDVGNLTLRWKSDKVDSFSPACYEEGGYLVWSEKLPAGEKFTVNVTYPTDAYAFNQYTSDETANENKFHASDLFAGLFALAVVMMPYLIFGVLIYNVFKANRGMGTTEKITRTIIEYYESCPNCGGTKDEKTDKCAYCGTSMVKSRRVIENDIVKDEADKQYLDYKKKGKYVSAFNPNTVCIVNVTKIPAPTTSRGGGRSSCAHSSCACACACACAGGGRAGCSTKDFFRTNLKLKNLLRREK